jgi:hypothetical protein
MTDFVAQSHTLHSRCVRFVSGVADGHATLAPGGLLSLTWAGLAPADRASFTWRTLVPAIRVFAAGKQDVDARDARA